jgi:hypothetical protein
MLRLGATTPLMFAWVVQHCRCAAQLPVYGCCRGCQPAALHDRACQDGCRGLASVRLGLRSCCVVVCVDCMVQEGSAFPRGEPLTSDHALGVFAGRPWRFCGDGAGFVWSNGQHQGGPACRAPFACVVGSRTSLPAGKAACSRAARTRQVFAENSGLHKHFGAWLARDCWGGRVVLFGWGPRFVLVG